MEPKIDCFIAESIADINVHLEEMKLNVNAVINIESQNDNYKV